MGAGKTTIGRQLAKRLALDFVDSDHEIEARTGVRIPVIFDIEGEAGFRKRESQVISELAQQDGLVVATGGGSILDPGNRANLNRSGFVAYLCVPPEILWERVRLDRNRPLLQVADPLAILQALYAQRDPLYREVADIIIEGNSAGAFSLVRKLEREIKQLCSN